MIFLGLNCQTNCNRPFVAYKHGIGDPLDPFAWNIIEQQLKDRLAKKNISQPRIC